jgi:hypothetical protein
MLKGVWWENKGKYRFDYLGVDGRTILKWMINK